MLPRSKLNTIAPAPERILQRLEWRVIRPLDGLLQGDYRTLFFGTGIDFTDLREYQAQDDIRHIDWNVTARMNTPYVRQYVEDREITAWFLLDLSPSMGFGPEQRSKRRVLVDFVATLARLLTRNGNRVAAILYSSQVDLIIPPRSGRNQVLRLIKVLLDGHATQAGSTTDLNMLLQAGLNTIKRRSFVFLVSDFFSLPGWDRSLSMLNQHHELLAIRMWDPGEVELPQAGFIVVEDSESGEQLFVDTGDADFQRRFHLAANRHEQTLKENFKNAGVEMFSFSTGEDLVAAIVRMAALRKKRRR
jgi:uncharacterized protein (DUF58 family)